MDTAASYGEIQLIADPLYEYIEITRAERDILDSPWLQRPRQIFQLQSTRWVFPSAEHSRFPHSLGSMHLAGVFARSIYPSLSDSCPDTPSLPLVEETLRMAGLLHDVGHGPFGHFFDREFLSKFNIDHEDISRHLVTNQLAELIGHLRNSPSGAFAPSERVDPLWVAWVMEPKDIPEYSPPQWLHICKPILCGPATVDNLDYVKRDAHHCAANMGSGYSANRLIHYSFVKDGEMVLHRHAMPALKDFLQARLNMYTQVYFHRTVRRVDLFLQEIFADTINLMVSGNPLENMDEYLNLTDWSIFETTRQWCKALPGSEQHRLGNAWQDLVTQRIMPWKLAAETLVPAKQNLSGLREQIIKALPENQRQLNFAIDVASANVVSQNPLTEDGMVAIYDELEDKVVRSRAQELLAQLPDYSQVVRVFTNDENAREPLGIAAAKALESLSIKVS